MSNQPHDDLFTAVLRHPTHAASWVRGLLPRDVADAIDWPTLQPAPERLRRSVLAPGLVDALFAVLAANEVGCVPTELWLLCEHKSYEDPGLPLQLLRYATLLTALAHDGSALRPGLCTPVLCVVLHHGDRPFARTSPRHPLDVLGPALRPIVDDLTATTEAELLARPGLTPQLRLLLLSLRTLRHCDADDAIAALHRWAQVWRDVDRSELPIHGDDAVQLFGWYLLHVTELEPERLHATLEVLLQRPETPIMSTATRLHAKGRVAALVRQLQKRFGPLPADVEPRLVTATSEQIDRYLDRVLDATSLAAVLAD